MRFFLRDACFAMLPTRFSECFSTTPLFPSTGLCNRLLRSAIPGLPIDRLLRQAPLSATCPYFFYLLNHKQVTPPCFLHGASPRFFLNDSFFFLLNSSPAFFFFFFFFFFFLESYPICRAISMFCFSSVPLCPENPASISS